MEFKYKETFKEKIAIELASFARANLRCGLDSPMYEPRRRGPRTLERGNTIARVKLQSQCRGHNPAELPCKVDGFLNGYNFQLAHFS